MTRQRPTPNLSYMGKGAYRFPSVLPPNKPCPHYETAARAEDSASVRIYRGLDRSANAGIPAATNQQTGNTLSGTSPMGTSPDNPRAA